MKKFKTNNSATFVNFKNHTNSSVSQGVIYTSAKSDTVASIIRNQIILRSQQQLISTNDSLAIHVARD